MVHLVLGGFAAVAVGLGTRAGDGKPPARPVTTADAVLAVYREDEGKASKGRPFLVAAVWPDGHAVWSADRQMGGPPYRAGRVEARKVADLLRRFDRDGLFADDALNRPNVGHHSQFHTVLVKSGKKQVRMQSWHELWEADGGWVGTDGGLELTDRPRLEVLRGEPAKYLYYRMVWAETRAAIADLLPADGKPVNGELVRADKPGEWVWQESAPSPKK
jgi:hypothetical protein